MLYTSILLVVGSCRDLLSVVGMRAPYLANVCQCHQSLRQCGERPSSWQSCSVMTSMEVCYGHNTDCHRRR